MKKPHRIAAGGLVFHENKVLLVRYRDRVGGTFLAGIGGAVEPGENVVQAIIREAREETGLTVQPQAVVAVEDMEGRRYKMCKIWMVCHYISGTIRPTAEAEKEGIIAAGWFTRSQLADEVVYPTLLMDYEWSQLWHKEWQVLCPPSREMDV